MSSDYEDRLVEMQGEVAQPKGCLQTEEATKNALVMPFIKDILGYDVFNPLEVVPEFTADQGLKKGHCATQILTECKNVGENLSPNYVSRLCRYYFFRFLHRDSHQKSFFLFLFFLKRRDEINLFCRA